MYRFAVRAGVALFAVQLCASAFDASPATRAAAASIHAAVHSAWAAVLPAGVARWDEFAARSDGHAVTLELLADLTVCVTIAGAWSLLDRRRRDPHRLAGALRLCTRYLVGVLMLVYGGFKVFPAQFPPPSTDDLLRPLGARSPMSLMWTFMGFSPAYSLFAGLAECIGGALLLFRRTTTLGALLIIGVMANVAMMNFAYDVPVKRLAVLLLIAAIALAARDVPRLLDVLVLDRPTRPRNEPAFAGPRWLRAARPWLKAPIVGLAIAGPLIASALVVRARSTEVPLRGVYEVQQFVRDGETRPPLTTDGRRWRRLVLNDRGTATVQYMDDRFVRYQVDADTTAHTLTLRRAGEQLAFTYGEAGDGTLQLRGLTGTDIAEMSLQTLPERDLFPLIAQRPASR